ncbi:hypothetical protein [Streptomyces sp. WAC06614]|uniref:hypothetical protein n=1 Tax=Streptomyces sp. WAC06614 TaxID=2487416 RepID=UPI000F798DFF|nr:hypothetical protein [Streptomyces sp. WAC06614]RSS68321.1 hypothetical protein EF918_28315 [Streptomyces sp. WAC06614]
MNALTAVASAAFGSGLYLVTFSTARWLNRLDLRFKITGFVVTGMVLCAVAVMIAAASRSAIFGFMAGATLTPSVHRWILRRHQQTAS